MNETPVVRTTFPELVRGLLPLGIGVFCLSGNATEEEHRDLLSDLRTVEDCLFAVYGIFELEALEKVGGERRVYNLGVEGDQVYLVGEAGGRSALC